MHLKQEDFEKDLERRKADLKSNLEKIQIEPKEEHMMRADKKHYRCRGYFREIGLDYDLEKYIFSPNDLIIDKHGLLSICIGVARSPDVLEGDVLWLFSEGEWHYWKSEFSGKKTAG
jgi:hypothetical protein